MNHKLTPKQIAEQKLKAFSIGAMAKRSLSKREQEELKKKEEVEAAAHAFQEFVETFNESPSSKTSKVWVKAGTYDAGKRQEDTREKGKLYKPQSKFSDAIEKNSATEKAQEYARLLGTDKKQEKPSKRKVTEKKKTNLELFKEELKMIQEEREERHKYKKALASGGDAPAPVEIPSLMSQRPQIVLPEDIGSLDCGDPNTTNIYLGNLNPKITEQELMELFGRYGPLASIKIMWPRSDEEKARGKNCGFVAFMCRKDGERAMRALNGKDIMQYEMKLGWGKNVPMPHYPIYIPPSFAQLSMPPPPSGLPFNAQPSRRDRQRVERMKRNKELPEGEDMDRLLYNSSIKVVVPTDRPLLMLVNRMIEFVIREGPMFEAMIMNRELMNPTYRFLFENQSPAHLYYRWKLFSMLQGDSQTKWCMKEFRMFDGGSVWRPPPMNQYTQGMPEELIDEREDLEPRKGSLSNTQRDRLEDLIRNMTPERLRVAESMVFCIEHADAAEEICDCIAESLGSASTPAHKKIARVYLISDILHNCTAKINNASKFRRGLETRLMQIFADVHNAYQAIESRIKAEGFKMRIMAIFRAWEDWTIYPREYLIRLQNTFLGLSTAIEPSEIPDGDVTPVMDPDLDGAPLEDADAAEDEDLDGQPLDGAALIKSALKRLQDRRNEDIDGVPMDSEDIDGVPMQDDAPFVPSGKKAAGGFVPSKWETVDPEQVEAQAMTTSKWDLLEAPPQEEAGQAGSQDDSDEDSTSQDADMVNDSRRADVRRQQLREVEVRVLAYQDELESGARRIKPGCTMQQQIQHYRKKLLRKVERGKPITVEEEVPERKRKHSPAVSTNSSKKSKRSRAGSDSDSPPHSSSRRARGRSRSRSNSPIRKRRSSSSRRRSRSYSPSPPPKRSSPHSHRKHRDSPTRSSKHSKHRSSKESKRYRH